MQTLNKKSRFRGVMEDINQSGNKTWMARITRKQLRFHKRFPFTPRGEELAAKAYQEQIQKLQTNAI